MRESLPSASPNHPAKLQATQPECAVALRPMARPATSTTSSQSNERPSWWFPPKSGQAAGWTHLGMDVDRRRPVQTGADPRTLTFGFFLRCVTLCFVFKARRCKPSVYRV